MTTTDGTALLAACSAADPAELTPWLELADVLRESDPPRWTWEVVHRLVVSYPAHDGPRELAAVWLSENAAEGRCRWCAGTGASNTRADGTAIDVCPECHGTGRTGDGRRERAEFIRVQVELARNRDHGHGTERPHRGDCEICLRLARLRTRERELLRVGRDAGWFRLPGFAEHVGYGEGDTLIYWEPGDSCGTLADSWGDTAGGFVCSLRLPAARWLAAAPSLAWHPGMTDVCGTCKGGKGVGHFSGIDYGPCRTCERAGRVSRPCPPTAQPITRVTLTTESGLPFRPNEDGTWANDRWPGIVFDLPAAVLVQLIPPRPVGDFYPHQGIGVID